MGSITLENIETIGQDRPEFTWSNKPSAAEFIGQAWFSDVGLLGYSDGVSWEFNKAIRTTPLRVATFGDSTAVTGDWSASATIDTTLFNSANPASGQTTQASFNPNFFMLPTYYPQAFLVANGGIGGQTAVQMLARDTAGAGVTRRATQDVIDKYPDVILFSGGSINDIVSLTRAQLTVAALDTIYTNHITLLERLLLSGALVIDNGLIGYEIPTPSTDDKLARQEAVVYLNNKIRTYINSLGTSNAVFLELDGIVRNSAGAYINSASSDLVHPNSVGAKLIAAEQAKIIYAKFGISKDTRYTGPNLTTNSNMLTVTTQSYGVVATGYTFAPNQATRGNATVEKRNGIFYQTIEWTPNNTGAMSCNMNAPITAAGLSLTSGDKFGIELNYFVEMVDQTITAPEMTLAFTFNCTKTANGKIAGTATMNNLNTKSFSGKLVLPPIQVNVDTADVSAINLFANCYLASADSIAANAIRFGIGNVRIVKL